MSNDLYRDALEKVKSEKEKNKIKAVSEGVFLQIIEGFLSMRESLSKNPEKVNEIIKESISKNIPKDQSEEP